MYLCLGGDENYLELNGYKVAYGRNLTTTEVEVGRHLFIGQCRCSKTLSREPGESG